MSDPRFGDIWTVKLGDREPPPRLIVSGNMYNSAGFANVVTAEIDTSDTTSQAHGIAYLIPDIGIVQLDRLHSVAAHRLLAHVDALAEPDAHYVQRALINLISA